MNLNPTDGPAPVSGGTSARSRVRSKRVIAQLACVILLMIGYLAVLMPVYSVAGVMGSTLGLIPAVLAAWFFGMRAGLVSGLFIVVLNVLLQSGIVPGAAEDVLSAEELVSNALIAAAVALIGALRDSSEQVKRELDERRRAEQALEASERYARSIVSGSLDMIITVDRDRKIVEFNKAAEEAFGYARAEILGRPIAMLFADPEVGQQVHRTTLQQGRMVGEVSARRKSGQVFTCALSAAALRDENGVLLGMVGAARDITESKRLDDALRRSERGYRQLVALAREGIWVIDADANTRLVNPRMAEMLGYTPEEMVGRPVFDFTDEPGVAMARANIERRRQGFSGQFDFDYLRKDGTRVSTNVSSAPVTDEHGDYAGTIAVISDITERKKMEAALRESEARYRRLFEDAVLGIFQTTLDGRILGVNPAYARLFGYESPEALAANVHDIANDLFVDPQRRTELMRQLAEGIELQSFENLYRRKDGSTFVGNLHARLVKDQDGHPLHLEGLLEDITERKQAEHALRESEERYRSLFENMLNGFIYCKMLYDDDGRPEDFICLSVNSAFAQLTGFDRVVGKKVTEVVPELKESNPELFEICGRVALTGQPEHFETEFKPIGMWFSASVYSTAREYFAGVFDNVTERKRAEEQRKREVDKLSALHEIDQALSTLDLQTCLNTVVEHTAVLFGTTQVALLLTEGENLRVVAEADPQNSDAEIVVPLDRGLTGWCCSHRQSVMASDAQKDERYIAYHAGTRAEMVAPLLAEADCIGVLNVESDKVGAFTPDDLDLLESLAARAATAIQNARLHAAERAQREFSETLREFGLVLTARLDPDVVLDQLLDLVARVVPYDSASVVILEDGIIRHRRQRGYERFGAADWLKKLEIPLEELPNLREMARTQAAYVVPDTAKYPDWIVLEGMRYVGSWVGAPITARGHVLGFLSLDKCERGYYTPEMAKRLEAFAVPAGLALENARLYAKQQELATTDGLTGLFNRRHFMELAEREYRRARRRGAPLSILMIDLDDFKHINDAHGHAAGDRVLVTTAQRLASSVRAIDVVGRYGGDEFVILLPDCDAPGARIIVERLSEQIRAQRVDEQDLEIHLGLSIGAATATLTGDETLERLLIRSDTAMYEEKDRHRRNREA